jgi:hypothetical protein
MPFKQGQINLEEESKLKNYIRKKKKDQDNFGKE